MYIAQLAIRNYRCYEDTVVDFRPGINVIIGENNGGKTALLRALVLLFDRRSRGKLDVHDFFQGCGPFGIPPEITVRATLRSSASDTLDDRALVATWLTKLEAPWEAQLTLRFHLPEEHHAKFGAALGEMPDKAKCFRILDAFLPKYISRVYGGDPANNVVAESEALAKFECQVLDAIRDVDSELFAGSNPLLRAMLKQVLDHGADPGEVLTRKDAFHDLASRMHEHLLGRLNVEALFNLVKATGASDGGEPHLRGRMEEGDLLAALRLFMETGVGSLPATHNGLGYNNLVYISLLLASLGFKSSVERNGQNAVLFPMLLIEEPEAHLHPALQYRLLKYVKKRLEEENRSSRQIFVTTHSTQITAASGLDPIICLSAPTAGERVRVSYPARAFGDDEAGRTSRKYVERYLDATKSNILFTRGIIFVEGLAELLLLPCLAEYVGSPLEEGHVAVVAVGGSTFKHFLPLFGAGTPDDRRQYALKRRVACVADADPARKHQTTGGQRKGCWPYQLHSNENFDYFPQSGAVTNLQTVCGPTDNIRVFVGIKTLEYDLALRNDTLDFLVTAACDHCEQLRELARNPATVGAQLQGLLDAQGPDARVALDGITDASARRAARFATCYLLCAEGAKGEHAFDLERQLRANLELPEANRQTFHVPDHLCQAIQWANGIPVSAPGGTS